MSLGEEFPKELSRVRQLVAEYRSLPDGAGYLGASIMELALKRADQASASGDVVEMIRSYEELKGFTG